MQTSRRQVLTHLIDIVKEYNRLNNPDAISNESKYHAIHLADAYMLHAGSRSDLSHVYLGAMFLSIKLHDDSRVTAWTLGILYYAKTGGRFDTIERDSLIKYINCPRDYRSDAYQVIERHPALKTLIQAIFSQEAKVAKFFNWNLLSNDTFYYWSKMKVNDEVVLEDFVPSESDVWLYKCDLYQGYKEGV